MDQSALTDVDAAIAQFTALVNEAADARGWTDGERAIVLGDVDTATASVSWWDAAFAADVYGGESIFQERVQQFWTALEPLAVAWTVPGADALRGVISGALHAQEAIVDAAGPSLEDEVDAAAETADELGELADTAAKAAGDWKVWVGVGLAALTVLVLSQRVR